MLIFAGLMSPCIRASPEHNIHKLNEELTVVLDQVEAPTMKNATSLSSVYSGDNITGKEVETTIIFSMIHDWQICM